jgi:hypothetical protein
MSDDKKMQAGQSPFPPPSDEDEAGRSGWMGSLYDASQDAEDSTGTGSGTGTGGKTGAIEFRLQDGSAGLRRDDLLAPNELKRLLQVHDELHKGRVHKQKTTREERAAKKDGRYVASMESKYQQGLGGGGGGTASRFKKHPISNMAQFSGIDKQVVGVPTLNEAETNADLKNDLENRLENKYRNTPRFNPRPRPPG